MRQCLNFYIDGAWVTPAAGSTVLDVINPATEQVSGQVAMGTVADVDRAVTAAHRAFPAYSARSVAERLDLLGAVISGYEKRIADIADAISTEMGAPYKTLALPAQAGSGLGHFKVAYKVLQEFQFERQLGATRVVREPIGVCALITPWNWPVNQIACKVAPALATGCTMVLKPSEFAPYSAQVIAEILHDAGVPAGVFNMIFGDGPTVGPAMSGHKLVDMVSLTGSTRAGASVSQHAAEGIKRVALELGGKSANIICPSADFSRAISNAVKVMMSNTGQSCNAPSRLFVPKDRLAEVEELAVGVASRLVVGDPRNETTNLGPLANGRQYGRVKDYITRGESEGARRLCGGEDRPDGLDSGYYVQPTIFSGVTDDMTIAREEIFGPVLSILTYDSVDEAVERANASDYGLSGYVYAETVDEARAVARRLRTGMVHLNGAGTDVKAPFGGYKQSGLGREWGEAGFEDFLETKSILGSDPAPKG